MAYEKTLWKDRVIEKPNTYRSVENPDGTITLYPITGQVIEKGTPISAANLNKIEDGIVELGEQLDNINTNKAGIDYVDNKVSKLIGGTPKAVYPNISSLEEEFPMGAEGIYITDDDKYWNYYDGERWTKGGIYQGNGISEDSVKDIHCKSMLTETNSLNSISNLLENSKKPIIGGKLNLNVKLENGILTCIKDGDKAFGFVAFSLSNNLIFNATSKTKWLMYYEENLNAHCIGLNGVDLGKKIIVNMNNFNVTSNGEISFCLLYTSPSPRDTR